MPVAESGKPGERRIAGYISWQGLSMLVQAGTQLGVMALLARYLTPEDFGLVAAANIVITLVQMISEGGIGTAVVQRPNVNEKFIGVAVTVSLIISAISFLGLGAVAFPFESLLGMKQLAVVVLVLGAGAFFAGISSLLEGLLQRDLRFAALFRVNLIGSVVGYVVPAVALAMTGAGVWALVVATMGRLILKLLLMTWMYAGSLRPQWDRVAARDLMHFGFGLTQDRFWNWLSAQTAPFAIGLLFGQAQLGQFYIGSQLAVLPAQYLSTIISSVYFPMVSRSLTDMRAAANRFLVLLTSVVVLCTTLGVFLALNSELVVTTMFGPGWDNAIIVFEILCLGAGVRSGIQICDSLNIARGDVYALANRRAVTAVVMFLGMYVGRGMGLAGAAWAVMVSHVLMLGLTMTLAFVGLGISTLATKPFPRRLGLASILLLASALPILYLRETGLIGGMYLLELSMVVYAMVLVPISMVLFEPLRYAVLRRLGFRESSKAS